MISPEGCASILWRTGEKAAEAAEALKLTANHLKELDVIDDIVPEPLGGAHRDPAEAATCSKAASTIALSRSGKLDAVLSCSLFMSAPRQKDAPQLLGTTFEPPTHAPLEKK